MTSPPAQLPPGSPPGLGYAVEFVTPEEEAELIALIGRCDLAQTDYDVHGNRRSRNFGFVYHHASDSFSPADPIPDGFRPFIERAGRFAGLDPARIEGCVLNRYEPGSSIPPHLDRLFWDSVMGLSLGAPCTLELSTADGAQAISLPLPSRSLYVMQGPARYEWRHAIPPVDGVRWSVTIRDRKISS